jgi:hypothetical protein
MMDSRYSLQDREKKRMYYGPADGNKRPRR